MLFLLDDGVPSVAKWVLLDGAAPDVPAVPPDPASGPARIRTSPEPGPDGDTADPDSHVRMPTLISRARAATPLRRGPVAQRLRRTGKLRVRVTVDEPATVDLSAPAARAARRARDRSEIEAGTHRLDLHPRRRTLRWLRHADNPRLRFSVVAVDAAENDTAWTRLLKPALN